MDLPRPADRAPPGHPARGPRRRLPLLTGAAHCRITISTRRLSFFEPFGSSGP